MLRLRVAVGYRSAGKQQPSHKLYFEGVLFLVIE